jgi:hypothetical protein
MFPYAAVTRQEQALEILLAELSQLSKYDGIVGEGVAPIEVYVAQKLVKEVELRMAALRQLLWSHVGAMTPVVVVVATVERVLLAQVEVEVLPCELLLLEELEPAGLIRVSSSATVPFKPSTNSNFITVELKKVTLLKP